MNKIFYGNVRHRHWLPKYSSFNNSLFMLCLDLDHLEKTLTGIKLCSYEKFNWLSYYRKNYFEHAELPLKEAVLNKIASECNQENYKVYLLTQLAFFGYCFNPLSVYFVYHHNTLQTIICEVTNTPWHQRHLYILDTPTRATPPIYHYETVKKLHVSPFLPMEFTYHFHVKACESQIIIHLENYKNNQKSFDATLSLVSHDLSNRNLNQQLKTHPLMTHKIAFGIYYQALKLWLKGFKLYQNPNSKHKED